MCPQTQCGAKCWPAPGPLGSQALDLCTWVPHPSTAWFSLGRGRLVSRGGGGEPSRVWTLLYAFSGLALSLGEWGWGWAVCLAWILPSLPLLGVPGLRVWLSLAPVGLPP